MTNLEDLSNEVRKLIGKDKTEKALELLVKAQLSQLDKELVLLDGRYNRIKSEQRMGIIPDHDAKLELNKINLAILDLSERIGSGKKQNDFGNPIGKKTNSSIKKLLIPSYIIFGIAITAVVIINLYNNKRPNKLAIEPIEFRVGDTPLTLVFHSHELDRKDTFLIDSEYIVFDLKEALIRHYKITIPEEWGEKIRSGDFNTNEYIMVNNIQQSNLNVSLNKAGIKNFDRIEIDFELVGEFN